MEAEIRAELESSGFSIGGTGPEDAAQILSTRKHARTPSTLYIPFFFSSFRLASVLICAHVGGCVWLCLQC
jgi:hypothetical protein